MYYWQILHKISKVKVFILQNQNISVIWIISITAVDTFYSVYSTVVHHMFVM